MRPEGSSLEERGGVEARASSSDEQLSEQVSCQLMEAQSLKRPSEEEPVWWIQDNP